MVIKIEASYFLDYGAKVEEVMELSGTKRWEKIDRKFQKVKPMLFDYVFIVLFHFLSDECLLLFIRVFNIKVFIKHS